MKKVIFLTFVLLVLTAYSQTKTINQQFADLQKEYKLQQKELEELKTKIGEVEKQSDKNFSTYQNLVMVGLGILTLIFGFVGILAPLWINNNAKENIKIMNEANNKLIDYKIKGLEEEFHKVDNILSTVTKQLTKMEDIKKKVLELEQQAQKSAKQSEESAKQSEAIRLFTEALKEEDIDKKITLYTEVIEINPKFPEAYYNRGLVYHNKQEYDNALLDYNRAIEINPKYAQAYNNRGNVYFNKQDYQNAIKDYTNALYVNSHNNKTCDNSGVCYNRGNAYFNKQDYQNAIKDYTQSIILNPHIIEIYEDRASAYRQLAQQDSNKSAKYIKLAEADEAQAKKLKSINK